MNHYLLVGQVLSGYGAAGEAGHQTVTYYREGVFHFEAEDDSSAKKKALILCEKNGVGIGSRLYVLTSTGKELVGTLGKAEKRWE